ncbi:MAG: hypothetical protein KDK70_35325, partial [Myxococcales bacterium]|nr:hypothetical protein [Myxococcales bacterium]
GHVRISAPFADFIDALLEPRADDRPPDAREARERLRQLGGGEPGPAREAEPRAALASRDRSPPALAAERVRLLRVLAARVRAAERPLPAAVPKATALQAVEPSGQAQVRIDGPPLVEQHPAPWWVLATRLAILGASAAAISAKTIVLIPVLLSVWIVSGLVVRYPVRLRPGRALLVGGLTNTDRPGRHWLRRRMTEAPHSIELAPLRIDWHPAPTHLDGAEHPAWLELRAELWVQPRSDEVGQFSALLLYRAWHEHPPSVASRLRREVIDGLVECIDEAELLERAQGQPLELGDELLPALDELLYELGLQRVALRHYGVRLVPQTEDLSSEDRVRLDRAPPPSDARALE